MKSRALPATISIALLGVVLLLAGCARGMSPTATLEVTMSPSPTVRSLPPSPSPALPTPTGTASPIIETATPPASATPTTTVVQPTSTEDLAGQLSRLQGLPIDEFFESSYRILLLRDPDRLFISGLAEGYGVPNDHFSDQSVAYQLDTAELESAILDLLRGYERDSLTQEQQLSYDIYEWYLEDRLQGHPFLFHNYPVNSLTIWGKQNWLVDFMVNYQPVESEQDALDYVSRLAQTDTWTEQLIEGLAHRAELGVIPPRYILEESISQIEEHIAWRAGGSTDPRATELYSSYLNKLAQLDGLTADQRQAYQQAALDEIQGTFIPSYLELRAFLEGLLPEAGEDGGAWTLPEGEAYYTHALGHETSSDLTPAEVHELGLAELARIQAQIESEAAELGYQRAELDQRLAEDSPLLQGNDLLKAFEQLIALADQQSRVAFNLYPSTELVVLQEPHDSLAYYLPPPYDGSSPGRFYVNLNGAFPQYMLPAFTYHETIPGHHVQGALTRELDLPTFRKDIEFNAYMEGWALYAERLAWELGLYDQDPLSNLGRLQFEEMRALRLVVDTGVHAQGWTWEEASARVEELTGAPISQGYLTRYYVLPGQASGYTIGMLFILDLRQRAMDRLGEDFNLAEFHDVILGNGPLPLEILENVVEEWIEQQF